jgi:hypothetical protein
LRWAWLSLHGDQAAEISVVTRLRWAWLSLHGDQAAEISVATLLRCLRWAVSTVIVRAKISVELSLRAQAGWRRVTLVACAP